MEMKPNPTIEELSKSTTINADELIKIIKDNFGVRSGIEEISPATKVDEFPENLQGQIGLTAWAFTRD